MIRLQSSLFLSWQKLFFMNFTPRFISVNYPSNKRRSHFMYFFHFQQKIKQRNYHISPKYSDIVSYHLYEEADGILKFDPALRNQMHFFYNMWIVSHEISSLFTSKMKNITKFVVCLKVIFILINSCSVKKICCHHKYIFLRM